MRFLLRLISFFIIWALFAGTLNGAMLNLPRPVTTHPAADYDPAVSPNARYLVYTSARTGNEEIWVTDFRDNKTWQVTVSTSSEYSPCFLDNGDILFVSTRDNVHGEIFVTDLKGAVTRKLIGGSGYFDYPAVSRKTKTVAYVHDSEAGGPAIYFHDLRTKSERVGPKGLDPAFSASGDSIVFVTVEDVTGGGRLAIFSRNDSAVVEIETGRGVDSHPAFSTDGRIIFFAKHAFDTDGDGRITRNDKPILMAVDSRGIKRIQSLYNGYPFGQPTMSPGGKFFASSQDGDIYSVSPSGLVPRSESAITQIMFADSLLKFALSHEDSLAAADAHTSAYDYFPDSCRTQFLAGASLYARLGQMDLAMAMLTQAKESSNLDFSSYASLELGLVRYEQDFRKSASKAWQDFNTVAGGIAGNVRISSKVRQQAYLDLAKTSHKAELWGEGNAAVASGLAMFPADTPFVAMMELWKLRNSVSAFMGDPLDLVILHAEYIDKYSADSPWADSAVADVLNMTRNQDPEIAARMLESVQENFADFPVLTGSAGIEQAKRFEEAGRRSVAQWKYNEILADYPRDAKLKFQALAGLGNLALIDGNSDLAKSYYDSAAAYIAFADSWAERARFVRKVVLLETTLGFSVLDASPQMAVDHFADCLRYDSGNAYAIWGMAQALSRGGLWDRWDGIAETIHPENRRQYFGALHEIAQFEAGGGRGHLVKARNKLRAAMELDFRDPLCYLSVGYVNCLLERSSRKALGLYEETLELSQVGLALPADYPGLKAAFHLNRAEAYYGIAQYENAYRDFRVSAELDSSIISGRNRESFLMHLGESAFQIDSLDVALQAYRALYDAAVASSNQRTQASYAVKLALIEQLLGGYDTALELYEKALPYYVADRDFLMVTNIHKGEAVCYQEIGDYANATGQAQAALGALKHVKKTGFTESNRIKLTIDLVNLEIPTFKMEPIMLGGSLYPKGFTKPANEAFLVSVSEKSNGRLAGLLTEKDKLGILLKGKEGGKTATAWSQLGRDYFAMGLLDSARSCFEKGYRISLGRLDYVGAYIDLVNWAATVLAPAPNDSAALRFRYLDSIGRECSRLYGKILPAYQVARANLRNIQGTVEFEKALYEANIWDSKTPGDIRTWQRALNDVASRVRTSLEESRRLYREASAELTLIKDPSMMATLSLNEAVISLALADTETARVAISTAVRQARLSGSEMLYAQSIAIQALDFANDTDTSLALTEESLQSFENMPPGASLMGIDPLAERAYQKGIELSLARADAATALFYLERRRAFDLANQMNLYSPEIMSKRLFAVYLDQARQYQDQIAGLKAQKRRLETLGMAGQLELKKVNDKILDMRSSFLNMKAKAEKEDPVLASFLFFDPVVPQAMFKTIPADEVYLAALESSGRSYLWACDSNGIHLTTWESSSVSLPADLEVEIGAKAYVTVISIDDAGEELKIHLRHRFPDKTVKSAYSFNEVIDWPESKAHTLEGISVIKFDGYSIPDSVLMPPGAGTIHPDSLGNDAKVRGSGWLVIDGEFHVDPDNPLLSYWEYPKGGEAASPGRFYVFDFYRFSTDAFGILVPAFPQMKDPAQKWAIFKTITSTGVSSVVTFSSLSNTERVNWANSFFEEMKVRSPVEAFEVVSSRSQDSGENSPVQAEYFGRNGWSSHDRKIKAAEWFAQFQALGDSAAERADWDLAARDYEQATLLLESAALPVEQELAVTQKLAKAYDRSGQTEKALACQKSYIEGTAWSPRQEFALWRAYEEIANGGKQTGQDSVAIDKMISISEQLADSNLMSQAYEKAAHFFLATESFDNALKYTHLTASFGNALSDTALVAESSILTAKGLASKGKHAESKAAAERALTMYESLRNYRDAAGALLFLASLERQTGSFNSERAWLQKALLHYRSVATSPQTTEVMQALAENFLNSGEPEEAKRQITSTYKQNPEDFETSLLLSRVYQYEKAIDSAMLYAKTAMLIADNNLSRENRSEAQANLGNVLMSAGDVKSAIDHYNLALEYRQRDSTSQYPGFLEYKRAAALSAAGITSDSLFRAIAGFTNDRFLQNLCYYQLGLLEQKRGKHAEAAWVFAALSESPEKNTARFLKWRSLYHLGEISKSGDLLSYLTRADSVLASYPPEAGSKSREYLLDMSSGDLYRALAIHKLRENRLESSVDYFERAVLSEVSSLHFSRGGFDAEEISLLRNANRLFENDSVFAYGAIRHRFLMSRPNYAPLWGQPAITCDSLMSSLKESQAVLRMYQLPDEMMLFLLAHDTLLHGMVKLDTATARKEVAAAIGLMKYADQADSVLEHWYTILIAPFEGMLDTKDFLVVVPDGPFQDFPLESLKRPGLAYLSDMLTATRSFILPSEFPSENKLVYIPCEAKQQNAQEGLTLSVINAIANAVGECDKEHGFVEFTKGIPFSDRKQAPEASSSILCEVFPKATVDAVGSILDGLIVCRDGYSGVGRILWRIPDQATAYYYWKLLSGLSSGEGLLKSHSDGISYNFGRYRGHPFYWSFSAFYVLN